MIPIPERMKALPLDRRGYPVPVTVYTDADGEAHFSINVEHKRALCMRDDLCPICGGMLLRGRWFVGGPASAFHERGAYVDPPMHDECAHYALKVCPWLAAPNYARRIDDRGLKPSDKTRLALTDPTTIPNRPIVFVAIMTVGQIINFEPNLYPTIIPKRPYRKIEYWKTGLMLDPTEGELLAKAGVEEAMRIAESGVAGG